jgi:hypothetical protein
MNTILGNLTVLQLQRALEIKQRIESLERELAQLGVGGTNRGPRRQMSAAARERIAAAQRARWAKQRKNKPAPSAGKRKMSAAARARIAAAQRRRWAAFKASQGK